MSVTDSTSTDHQYIVESTYTAVLVYVLAQYKLTYFINSHDLYPNSKPRPLCLQDGFSKSTVYIECNSSSITTLAFHYLAPPCELYIFTVLCLL